MAEWHAEARERRRIGQSVGKIAAQLKVPYHQVSRATKSVKLPLAAQIRRAEMAKLACPKPKRPENDDRIRAGYEAGEPVRCIADDLGVSRNVVIGRASRLGLTHRSFSP